MNYDELYGRGTAETGRTPLGGVTRRGGGGTLTLRAELLGEPLFAAAVRGECGANAALDDPRQLHFRFEESEGTIVIEDCRCVSLERLLRDDPSAAGRGGFILGIVRGLLEHAEYIHSHGIYHVCYAPAGVFVRQGGNEPLLTTHGSFYSRACTPEALYAGMEGYIAPEVLSGSEADERSDVYSIGKLAEHLYATAVCPYCLRAVIRKAAAEAAEDRYASAEAMLTAINTRTKAAGGAKMFIAAAVIALIVIGAFFALFPEPTPTEYVSPARQVTADDILDGGFDPDTELGAGADDTIALTPEEAAQMKAYEAKCEDIFRKRFAQEADRILSKIYNSTYMGRAEKDFIAASQSTTAELIEAQRAAATEAGISDARSQAIATEIIERLTEEKKSAMTGYGVQK